MNAARDRPRTVAVIGGGSSGRTVSFEICERLRDRREEIELICLEGSFRAGGHLRTTVEDGYLCEWGPNGFLDNEPATPLPADSAEMATILAGVLDDLGRLYESLDRHFDDASWVTSRFVEILPIDLEEKQRCLEQSDPVERLRIVRALLESARSH